MSVQHLNLLHTSEQLHVQNCEYLVRVGLDAPLSDQIFQELSGGHPQCALFEVEFHFVLSKEIESFV